MADFGRIPKGERFAMVPAFALTLSEVKPGPKALYASLCANASEKGLLWRSWKRLGEELGVSKRQIQRWVFDLERLGLVVRMGWRGHVPLLMVIRDQTGRAWARATSVKNVIARRAKSAAHGRDGALKRWEEEGTNVSSVSDADVPKTTSPMSSKHNLPNKNFLTKEGARQEGERSGGRASKIGLCGLKRLAPSPNAAAVQERLNELAAEVGGWEIFLDMPEAERIGRLKEKCGPGVGHTEIATALGVT